MKNHNQIQVDQKNIQTIKFLIHLKQDKMEASLNLTINQIMIIYILKYCSNKKNIDKYRIQNKNTKKRRVKNNWMILYKDHYKLEKQLVVCLRWYQEIKVSKVHHLN
jgi:hypothetical protein